MNIFLVQSAKEEKYVNGLGRKRKKKSGIGDTIGVFGGIVGAAKRKKRKVSQKWLPILKCIEIVEVDVPLEHHIVAEIHISGRFDALVRVLILSLPRTFVILVRISLLAILITVTTSSKSDGNFQFRI